MYIDFGITDTVWVNPIDCLTEEGFSKSEAKRLLRTKSVKVWDTRIINNGTYYEWFQRPVKDKEIMINSNDPRESCICVGKFRVIRIYQAELKWWIKLYRKIRFKLWSIPILDKLFFSLVCGKEKEIFYKDVLLGRG